MTYYNKNGGETSFNINIIFVLIFAAAIIFAGVKLYIGAGGDSFLSEYPKDRMVVLVKSSKFKSAIAECQWCDLELNSRYITLIAKEESIFRKVVVDDSNLKELCEAFPEIYELTDKNGEIAFRIKRNYNVFSGGTVPLPSALIYSLLNSGAIKNL